MLKHNLIAKMFVGFISIFVLSNACFAADPAFITIAGGPTSGVFNVVVTGVSSILKKEFNKTTFDVQPGGAGPNLLRASAKDITFGVTSANNAADVWVGREPAKPNQPIKNIRAVCALFPSAVQLWVPEKSSINKFADLKGKKLSAGQVGQTSWQPFIDIMAISGIKPEGFGSSLLKLNWQQSVQALDAGKIDALFWLTTYPHSSIQEIEQRNPMRLVNMDPAAIKKYCALQKGFMPVTIKAGTYNGNQTDIKTCGTVTYLFTTDDIPEDIVYRATKAIYNNLDKLYTVHSVTKYVTKDTIAKGLVLPFHPGAIKFYKEAGIKMDAPVVK